MLGWGWNGLHSDVFASIVRVPHHPKLLMLMSGLQCIAVDNECHYTRLHQLLPLGNRVCCPYLHNIHLHKYIWKSHSLNSNKLSSRQCDSEEQLQNVLPVSLRKATRLQHTACATAECEAVLSGFRPSVHCGSVLSDWLSFLYVSGYHQPETGIACSFVVRKLMLKI